MVTRGVIIHPAYLFHGLDDVTHFDHYVTLSDGIPSRNSHRLVDGEPLADGGLDEGVVGGRAAAAAGPVAEDGGDDA